MPHVIRDVEENLAECRQAANKHAAQTAETSEKRTGDVRTQTLAANRA